MKLWIFISLIILAIGFGFWLQWYGNRCEECQERKRRLIDYFGGVKSTDTSKEVLVDKEKEFVLPKDMVIYT